MSPRVSCILATKDRPHFVTQAVRYFLRQSYPNKELIVVDDGELSVADALIEDPQISCLRLERPTNLGAKLNVGIEASTGDVIQKLDDDDYYRDDFLQVTVGMLLDNDLRQTIVACDCFLVLLASTGKLVFSGYGWSAGPTLCFHRELWEQRPFRDVPSAVDWWFLKDHSPDRIKIQQPELFILVRHGFGHVWNQMKDCNVTNYFSRRSVYEKTLSEIVSPEDFQFYSGLRSLGPEEA